MVYEDEMPENSLELENDLEVSQETVHEPGNNL